MTLTSSPAPSLRRRRSTARHCWSLLLALVLIGSAAAAPFRLIEGTADGGGQHSQGTRFAIEGSLGQPDAGMLTGNRFAIDGGFWRPSATTHTDSIFANGFED